MNEEKIIKVTVPIGDAIAQITALTSEMAKLKAIQDSNTQSTEKDRQQYEANKIVIKDYANQKRQLTNEVAKEIQSSNQALGVYQKLQNQYSKAAAEAKNLGAAVAQGDTSLTGAFNKASQKAFDLSEKLKAVDKSVGQNQRSVGDYGLVLRGLPGIFGEMAEKGQSILVALRTRFESVKDATMMFSESLSVSKVAHEEAAVAAVAASTAEAELAASELAGTATASQAAAAETARATATSAATVATEAGSVAMKVFKIALASTGIGILLVAVGALVTYFTSTNEGAKQFQRVMSGVNAVIQEGVKFMGSLGKLIVDVLTGNVKELGSDIKAIGDNWKNASGNIKENYELGNKIADQRQKLTKAEREFSTEKIRQQGIIDVLALKIRQSDTTPAQRKKAADETMRIDNELHKKEMFFANENLRITQLEQSVKSKKDLQAIADAKNRVQSVIAEDNRFEQSVKNRVGRVNNTLAKAADTKEAREIKSTQTLINERAKVLDNENKIELLSETIYNRRAEKIKTLYNDEISLINKQASFEKWSIDKIDTAKEVAKDKEEKRLQSIATIRTNLIIEQMQTDLKIIQLAEDEKTVISGKSYQMQKDDLLRNYNASMASNALKLANDKEYVDQSLLIDQQYSTDKANLNNNISESKKQLQLNDINNQLETAHTGIDLETQLKKDALNSQMQDELRNTNLTESQRLNIIKKYETLARNLDRASLDFKLQIALQTANSLAAIFGKTTKAGKAAASAGIAIDSIAGAIKAFNSMASIPVVGPVLGGIAAAGVIATGIQSIKDVWAVSDTGTTGISGGSSASTPTLPPDTASKMASPLSGSVSGISSYGGANVITSGAATSTNISNQVPVIVKPVVELSLVELKRRQDQVNFIDNISSVKA